MNTTTVKNEVASTADHLGARVAGTVQAAADATKRGAEYGLDAIEQGVDTLRTEVPNAFNRAAAQANEITRRGIERARQVSGDVRDQVGKASDNTVAYIKDEPIKSVLLAAAAGATFAGLAALLMRSRRG